MDFKDLESPQLVELAITKDKELSNEIKDATSYAIENVFILTDLTFQYGADKVNKVLKQIQKEGIK